MIQTICLVAIIAAAIMVAVYISDNQGFTPPTHRFHSKGYFMDFSFTNSYRGVAILMVMLSHISGKLDTNILTPLGGIGVAIFLILSGYGLNESYKHKGIDGFWDKKIYRIIIPFIMLYIFLSLINAKFTRESFINHFFSLNHEYWYVTYLILCYLVFWVASKYLSKYRLLIFAFFAIISFSCMSGLQAEQALSFPVGILISEQDAFFRKIHIKHFIPAIIILFIVGIVCLAVKQLPLIRIFQGTWIYYAVELGIKLPIGIAIILLCYLQPKKFTCNAIYTFMGAISYELYLVHMVFLKRGMVQSSFLQGIALIIISTMLSYSYNKFNIKIKRVVKNGNNREVKG